MTTGTRKTDLRKTDLRKTDPHLRFSRRELLLMAAAGLAAPSAALGSTPREVTWAELIPEGVPYSEIIGEGEMDFEADIWLPVFDEHATKLNTELDGAVIRIPGYVLPLELTADGVTEFILVPYVGACIHVPPPPPNQLVFVATETPWRADSLWDAVWVTGRMSAHMQTTELAAIGYALAADEVELFEW